jgi:hypothetical protein
MKNEIHVHQDHVPLAFEARGSCCVVLCLCVRCNAPSSLDRISKKKRPTTRYKLDPEQQTQETARFQ